jgi:hypothetical protein
MSIGLLASPISAQVLSITETTESGKTRNLTEPRQTIDINSQLNININPDSIRKAIDSEMQSGGSKAVDSLIFTLKIYKTYIEKLDATIRQYELVFQDPRGNVDLTVLTEALRLRGIAGQTIINLFPDGSRFKLRREEELSDINFGGKGSNERFRLIMRLLADEMKYTEDDLMRLRKEAGYMYQLAAWSVTKRGQEPLHLEGFDELPPGEFYRYERHQLYLTEEQLNELESLSAFFEDMDRKNVFSKIADVLPGILARAIDIESITEQLKTVKGSIQALITEATTQKQNMLDEVSRFEENWKMIKTDIETLREKYMMSEGASGAESKVELLKSFMNDVASVSTRVKTLYEEAKSFQNSVDLTALGAGAEQIKLNIKNLQDLLLKSANNLIDHSREGYQMALYGRQINSAALELSEKVLNLSTDNIPPSTTLDLLYSGKREPGDLIVIKSMIRKGDDKYPFVTEKRDFPIMNALPHVQMSVVYAFSKPVVEESNWKGGPLVSILYKFKSWSLPYRNFLDPGIGLHAASFDFNNDDTPEFAGGMVVSIFKDYLQGGWGFNFNANRGYWFAGLRIPIPTSPITLTGN